MGIISRYKARSFTPHVYFLSFSLSSANLATLYSAITQSLKLPPAPNIDTGSVTIPSLGLLSCKIDYIFMLNLRTVCNQSNKTYDTETYQSRVLTD